MGHQNMDFVEKDDLNYYFNNQVTIERTSSQVAHEVTLEYVHKLLDCIHEKDPRFGKEPLKVGSAAQRLKVGDPDEYDFGIILQGLPDQEWAPRTPRYFRLVRGGDGGWKYEQVDHHDTVPDNLKVVKSDVPLPAPDPGYTTLKFNPANRSLWRSDHSLHFEDYLIPFLLKRKFKELLVQAVRDLGLREHVYVSRKVSGPAVTVTIEHRRLSTPVSVDFAPTARINIVFPAQVTWPRPSAKWPSRAKAAEVKAKGVNLVAKKDMDWIISYAEPERELRENMDEDGGCRAKIHRIMKKVKDDFLCKTTKPVLSSYHLKNLLFWECEDYPDSGSWLQDMLAERFNSMLDRLEGCLRTSNLQLYFDPRVNLLKDRDRQEMDQVVANIHKFKRNSSEYLQKPEC